MNRVLKEMIMPSVKEEGVMEQYIVLEAPYYDRIRHSVERFLSIKVLMQFKQQRKEQQILYFYQLLSHLS